MAETITIVSSISRPSASRNANSVKKLIVISNSGMRRNVAKNVSGIVIDEIIAWRRPTKMNKHRKTKKMVV